MHPAPRPHFTKRYRIVTEEKAGGATYTPSGLADFVASQIAAVADLSLPTIRILDPAIGDGELLLSLLAHLKPYTAASVIVHGFDTDRVALEQARRRLQGAFPAVTLHLESSNFLEFVLREFAGGTDLFRPTVTASQFDLIIANPPYVRTQIMGAEQAQMLATAFGLSGRVDLYHAFLIGMAQVLRPGGTAGIIVSNRFMTTKGGSAVRIELRARFNLRHIWDLGDTKLFEAAVLPAIILAEGRNGHDGDPPAFTSIYETDDPAPQEAIDPIEALAMSGNVALPDGRHFRVQQGTLDSSGSAEDVWRVATPEGDTWLATVTRHTWRTFGQIGKIRVGVKTCADKVFIRSDWNTLPLDQQPEVLRPVTTHHTGSQFRATPDGKRRLILYPHESVGGERRAIDLQKFPRTRAYLEAHRTSLETRSYVLEAGRKWYEIWVAQDPAAWDLPKLVFRDISERPTFWIDLEGTIVNGDCYWLAAEGDEATGWLWLAAAVANSTFVEAFYDHRFNNKLYAGRRRFITQYVEQFPLPDPTTMLARQIVAATKAIYSAPDSVSTAGMKADLDRMVWRAFGLGIEEVGR
jgi:tRNA1(Val) A37 N6-methylase TrmN6